MKTYIDNFKKYRFLLTELVKKDVKLKYRRSKLGIFWTLLEPILTTIVLTIVFSGFRGKSDPTFPVYILSGRLLFSFFSGGTKAAARSIRTNSSMMRKVYVPKYMYPLATILSNFVIFLISLIVLVGASIIMPININWHVFLAIVPLTVMFFITLGTGMILATAEVFFRDLEYLWGVITTLIMYCSGIFYKIEDMGQAKKTTTMLQTIMDWNPVYAVIKNFRCCVYLGVAMDYRALIYSCIVAIVLTVIGIYVFFKKQDEFILNL